MQQPRIIIVDSAGGSALPYARLVARLQPLEVRVETSLDKALVSLSRDSWDLGVVTARSGPTADVLYTALRKADPQLPMVVIDPKPNVDTARACLQAGAGDYLDVARVETDLEDALERLLRTSRRRAAEEVLRRAVERPYSFAEFLGESPVMQQVYSIIDRVATSSVDVFVTGETGTGKELVARAIHTRSRRAAGPFVPVDCGAIPDALIESELFGHERGAFTGADARRMGLVEFADGGTLFLDEVGELPLTLQAKLLRVLENGEFQRVGETQLRHSQARVLTATNRDLRQEVRNGAFRADLYHRLSVFTLAVPPLRDLELDKRLLLDHFRVFYAEQAGVQPFDLDERAMARWLGYPFPGNVRELRNIVIRLTTKHSGQKLSNAELEPELDLNQEAASVPSIQIGLELEGHSIVEQAIRHLEHEKQFDLDGMLRMWEKGYIEAALRLAKGNVSQAAKMLGINRTTLYSRMGPDGK